MQLRVTILNLGNLAAQGFGGLIAAGILANMEDAGGIRAWRWLFIIEGAITVAFGIVALFILPGYPSSTSWLSTHEREIAEGRLSLDIGGADQGQDESAWQGLKMALTDPKVWLLGLTYHATIMGLSVRRLFASYTNLFVLTCAQFVFFFPTITQALGYNTTTTLLLTAPPWMWACLVSLPNAWHADKTGERFFHYFGPAATCIVGYIISMTTTTTAPRYFAMFLMTSESSFPPELQTIGSNVAPSQLDSLPVSSCSLGSRTPSPTPQPRRPLPLPSSTPWATLAVFQARTFGLPALALSTYSLSVPKLESLGLLVAVLSPYVCT